MSAYATSADAILAVVARDDPSIDAVAGRPLVETCLSLVAADPGLDAAGLARGCLSRHRGADVSWVNHIARAVVAVRRSR